jgi:xylose isomerase
MSACSKEVGCGRRRLNIEPNHTALAGHDAVHDIYVASIYGKLGSIDSNTGDTLLGWDTDNFPMDVAQTTAVMSVVREQEGRLGADGGLNFDCRVRRESVDPVDLFIGHIGAMDTYALGLRKASKMKEEGTMTSMREERYLSWKTESIGQTIEQGEATLEECAHYAKSKGEPKKTSGQQELFELVRNRYLYGENRSSLKGLVSSK